MCSNIRIKTKDGAVIIGRTMDLGADLHSEIMIFPRDMEYKATGPNGEQSGLTWKGKYGFVGLNGLGKPIATDGINEKGLYCGSLYLPGFTKYPEVAKGQENQVVSQIEMTCWILSNVATIEEAKQMIPKVQVWGLQMPPMNEVMALHFVVHDAQGNSAVFEYVGGVLNIHDNPLGVVTNSPTYDWHMTNLRNYVNLTTVNAAEQKIGSVDLKPIGEGSGLLGLPGDFTPPSRFVRAVALTQGTLQVDDADKGVATAFHIIDNLDLPEGISRLKIGDKTIFDVTQWMSVVDLKNLRYFVRYYDRPGVIGVELTKVDFSGSVPKTLKKDGAPWYTDVSTQVN